jgi:sulfite exporter TauE/SafE
MATTHSSIAAHQRTATRNRARALAYAPLGLVLGILVAVLTQHWSQLGVALIFIATGIVGVAIGLGIATVRDRAHAPAADHPTS